MAKKTDLSNDVQVFRDAVRGVKPIEAILPPQGLSKRRPPARRRPAAAGAAIESSMPLVDGADKNAVTSDQPLIFQRAGVRTQEIRRLRRGLYPIENNLDLHGLTQSHARTLLSEFISQSQTAGFRCVRIVHGKGYRSGLRGPVLKIAINTWLRHHTEIMAFTSARAIDGGTGAVYVLLRA